MHRLTQEKLLTALHILAFYEDCRLIGYEIWRDGYFLVLKCMDNLCTLVLLLTYSIFVELIIPL